MSNLDLSELSEKEIDALQGAINRKKRMRIDWDNMTDQERAQWNKTIEPRTFQTQYFEYPKTLYGKWPNGEVKTGTVDNEHAEAKMRAENPLVIWERNALAHGIETCPSPPSKSTQAGFTRVGTAPVQSAPVAEVAAPMMVEDHPAAVAARRGRPPGSKNLPKQEAA